MIDRLLNQSAAPTLERAIGFAAARHKVLADNVANISTPGYRSRDLDATAFAREVREAIDRRDEGGTRDLGEVGLPQAGPSKHLVFHDGNDRDVEHLVGEQAKNALRHNVGVELLRKQYGLFHMALRERVA